MCCKVLLHFEYMLKMMCIQVPIVLGSTAFSKSVFKTVWLYWWTCTAARCLYSETGSFFTQPKIVEPWRASQRLLSCYRSSNVKDISYWMIQCQASQWIFVCLIFPVDKIVDTVEYLAFIMTSIIWFLFINFGMGSIWSYQCTTVDEPLVFASTQAHDTAQTDKKS